MDGTPILDIRPYVPYVDSLPHAQAGFAPEAPLRSTVGISPEVGIEWSEIPKQEQDLITGMISLKPGPAYQAGESREYRARVAGWEVKWRADSESALVIGLEK